MLSLPGVAFAQAMADPTRPPTEYAEAESGAPAAAGPVLQSVMITPTLKAAIINGEMVKLGGQFGNAKLVKVSESEAVLKSGDETQVLKMYPGVEKRESAKTAPKAASRHTPATQQKPADAGPGTAR
ncbi:MAG: MSHA biogenesis protein MshK [Burkholderiales bacterium]|nr:MSHA biogenesis protein MshK [Burkholderiales bacterium]